MFMTLPPWMRLETPIPGCNLLQICGLFSLFCRDFQSYLVDRAKSPVQFEILSSTPYPLLPVLMESSISSHAWIRVSLLPRLTISRWRSSWYFMNREM